MRRTIFKWTGIGCGGLLVISLLLAALGAILEFTQDEAPNHNGAVGSNRTVTTPTPRPSPDTAPTPVVVPALVLTPPTPLPTATPTPVPTPTATPTPTPTPIPLRFDLKELLGEYEKNKVLANTKYRYIENGGRAVTVSGIVTDVEDLHVSLGRGGGSWSFDGVRCYYSDTRAALRLSKGQEVTVTGRIRGQELGDIVMFQCEVAGVRLDKPPTARPDQVRNNVVVVYCYLPTSEEFQWYYGTGVLLDNKQGTVLTAHHIVEDDNECTQVEVSSPEGTVRMAATVVKHCASIDKAILQIPPNHPALSEAVRIYPATAPAQEDQDVYFWAFGTEILRMEKGIVDGVFMGGDVTMKAHSVRGDSGSPVFNEHGNLLGIMKSSNRSDVAAFNGGSCS